MQAKVAVGPTATFCFNLPARILVDGVEAVVVLIAFGRFAQFRAMSATEPAPARRKAAATIMTKLQHDLRHCRRFRRLSCQATIPRFSNPRTYQGNAQCNRMHPAVEFFQQTVPRRVSVSTIRQIFEQCCQILNSREAIMPLAPAALGGEHFGRRNLHFNGSPKKLEQDPNPFFRREQLSNQDLKSLKGPLDDLNRLADLNGRIDGHDFFCTYARLKPDYNVFRQGRQVIAKVDDSPP